MYMQTLPEHSGCCCSWWGAQRTAPLQASTVALCCYVKKELSRLYREMGHRKLYLGVGFCLEPFQSFPLEICCAWAAEKTSEILARLLWSSLQEPPPHWASVSNFPQTVRLLRSHLANAVSDNNSLQLCSAFKTKTSWISLMSLYKSSWACCWDAKLQPSQKLTAGIIHGFPLCYAGGSSSWVKGVQNVWSHGHLTCPQTQVAVRIIHSTTKGHPRKRRLCALRWMWALTPWNPAWGMWSTARGCNTPQWGAEELCCWEGPRCYHGHLGGTWAKRALSSLKGQTSSWATVGDLWQADHGKILSPLFGAGEDAQIVEVSQIAPNSSTCTASSVLREMWKYRQWYRGGCRSNAREL